MKRGEIFIKSEGREQSRKGRKQWGNEGEAENRAKEEGRAMVYYH